MAKLGSKFIKFVSKLAMVCVIHFGYINAGKSWIIGIFHVISGFWLHFAGNILKTQEIQGKMHNTLVKWATLYMAFPEYLGYSSQLYICSVAFCKGSGSPG